MRFAIGRQFQISGPVAHQQQHDHRRHDDRAAHQQHCRAPAMTFGQARKQRQKGELPGRRAGRQQPHDKAAPLPEPARRNRGAQHHRRQAGPYADHHAPQQHQLPQLRHAQRQQHPANDDRQRNQHHAPHAEAVHEGGGERPHAAEQQEPYRERAADIRRAPAELLLQRHDQDAGRPDRAGHDQHGEKSRAGDRPAIMNVARSQAVRKQGRQHQLSLRGPFGLALNDRHHI